MVGYMEGGFERPLRACRHRNAFEHAREARHDLCLLSWEQVTGSVHRQRDRTVSHYVLYSLGMGARHGQPDPAGMAEAVEVQTLASVVRVGREIGLLTPSVLLGILLGDFDPCRSSRSQIGSEHRCGLILVWHCKNRGTRCLGSNMPTQLSSEIGLNVLPGILAILGAGCLGPNEGRVQV